MLHVTIHVISHLGAFYKKNENFYNSETAVKLRDSVNYSRTNLLDSLNLPFIYKLDLDPILFWNFGKLNLLVIFCFKIKQNELI